MPNVLDGIRKMSKEQQAYKLATLEIVTMKNTFSEAGQKISNKVVKTFNWARKHLDFEPVKEPEIISLNDRIQSRANELLKESSSELLSNTRSTIVSKLLAVGAVVDLDSSDDELSIEIIEAGCKSFKKQIDDDLSPAQKADAIYQRYNERLVAQVQKEYEKASDDEKRKIDDRLKENIESLSEKEKDELKKALHVDELTTDVMKRILTTSAGASAVLIALNASGFGAFIALTTIIHAVFTTTLGITLPFAVYTTSTAGLSLITGPLGWILMAGIGALMFKSGGKKLIYEVMAQIVWASVLECGGCFTPKDETLPSWLPEDLRKAAIEDNQKLIKLLKKVDELSDELERKNADLEGIEKSRKKNKRSIEDLNEKIKKQTEQIKSAEAEREQLAIQLEKANSRFQQYEKYANTENKELHEKYESTFEKYQSVKKNLENKEEEIETLKSSNADSEEMIKMYEEENKQLVYEKEELKDKNNELAEELAKLKKKKETAETSEAKKLQQRWESAYKKFEFDTGVIKSVVKIYEYNEYGHIERRLMELHETKDPAALSSNRGKMVKSGELHLEVSTPSGFPSRIFYTPLKNASNGKMVKITQICKHNDSRYGK